MESHEHRQDAQRDHAAFLMALREIVGDAALIVDRQAIAEANRNCGDALFAPLAVVTPRASSEIAPIVHLSAAHKVPLYPISRGCNWGYGSASPSSPGCLLLDLRNLNRILEYDAELAYVVVEPGVTQMQLHDFLIAQGARLRADVTGSSPEASVLGSILERGYGLSLYADRFLHSTCLEVMLADGSILHTGFGRFPNAKTRNLYRSGVGPAIEGLFTQSNFGIVLRATLWLMPTPEYGGVLTIRFPSDESFISALPALRDLRLRGVLRSAVHVASELRVVASMQQHPAAHRADALSEAEISEIRGRWGAGAWNVVAGLWGTKAQVRAELGAIRRALRGHLVLFQSERLLDFWRKHPRLCRLAYGRSIERKLELFELLKGKPSRIPLRAAYWRLPQPPPEFPRNIAHDGCGVLWCSPMIPARTDDLRWLIDRTRTIIRDFGLEFNVAVTLLAERACCGTVGLFFDRNNAAECKRARECHAVLLREYIAAGYPPYRMGADLSDAPPSLFAPNDATYRVHRAIKGALDPHHLIAPGRYGL